MPLAYTLKFPTVVFSFLPELHEEPGTPAEEEGDDDADEHLDDLLSGSPDVVVGVATSASRVSASAVGRVHTIDAPRRL